METPTEANAVKSGDLKKMREESSRIFTSSIEKIPEQMMKKIEKQLAFGIGPIARVVLKREIKKMGFSYDSFPKGSIIPLIEKLTAQIKDDKREEILTKVEDLIFTSEE